MRLRRILRLTVGGSTARGRNLIFTIAFLRFQRYDEALATVSEGRRQYVSDQCLAALYIPLLLNRGLGFTNESTVIHVPRHIARQKPGKHRAAVTTGVAN